MISRIARTLGISLLCAVVGGGCTKSEAKQQAPEMALGPMPAPETVAGGKVITAPPDSSLTLDEYIKLGVPASDRAWSADEMKRAAQLLAAQNPAHLPRYRSDRSGLLFARLTSAQNLETYGDKSLRFSVRMDPAMAYFGATNDLLQLYLAGLNHNATGDSELIELLSADLRMAVVVLRLVDEAQASATDPADAQRAAGLEKVRNGLATMAAGALTTLTETTTFRTSERLRLLQSLQTTLPAMISRLTPSARAEILVRIHALTSDSTLVALRPGLDSLERAASSAAKP